MLHNRLVKLVAAPIMASMLYACSDIHKFELNIAATVNGKPAEGVSIVADGATLGFTDSTGHLKVNVERRYGESLDMKAVKDVPGYRVQEWQQNVTLADPDKGGSEVVSLQAEIKAAPYAIITVKEEDKPLKKVSVKLNGNKIGETNDHGSLEFSFDETQATKLSFEAVAPGYKTGKSVQGVKPGANITMLLEAQLQLNVVASTERYGKTERLSDVAVYLGDKMIGKTDKNGRVAYLANGVKNKDAVLRLDPPGASDLSWAQKIRLTGAQSVERYFYQNKDLPIKVGLFRFASNIPGEEVGDIPTRFQNALEKNLGDKESFKVVASADLMRAMKNAKLSPKTITTKGWENSALHREVDVIGIGSISKTKGGDFVAEINFYAPNGGLVASQLSEEVAPGKIDRAMKKVAVNVYEEYPYQARVLAVSPEEKNVKINVGDKEVPFNRKDEFTVLAAVTEKNGRIKSYKPLNGALTMSERAAHHSVLETAKGMTANAVPVGSLVVRRSGVMSANDFANINVKGEISGKVVALGGVNVYLNNTWAGATDMDGKVRVPVNLKKNYDITLYKHGYDKIQGEFEAKQSEHRQEYTMKSFNVHVAFESEPTGAAVFIDNEQVGKTPWESDMSTGFHTVRVSAGGDLRDWEQVMEFNSDVRMTGESALVFVKDYLKLGAAAEKMNRTDDAIAQYTKVTPEHPDYAEALHRAGVLFMEKKSPAEAVAALEKVTAVPEVSELVLKQFSVAYTNMGHAYHDLADKVMHNDPKKAAELLTDSIKALGKAKKNTRFFPNESYAEAVHDTYFYTALSYQKLYQMSKRENIKQEAKMAWRDYMDYFPEALEAQPGYKEAKASAVEFMNQIESGK